MTINVMANLMSQNKEIRPTITIGYRRYELSVIKNISYSFVEIARALLMLSQGCKTKRLEAPIVESIIFNASSASASTLKF